MRVQGIPQATLDLIEASLEQLHRLLPDMRQVETQAQAAMASYAALLPTAAELEESIRRTSEIIFAGMPSPQEIQRLVEMAQMQVETPDPSLLVAAARPRVDASELIRSPRATIDQAQLNRIESKLNRLLPPDDPMDLN